MVNKILKFLLLASPVAYNSKLPLKQFDIGFFYIGVVLIFVASLFDEPKRKFNEKYLIASLFGLCLFNIILHSFSLLPIIATSNLLLCVMVLYIIVIYVDSKSFSKYINIAVVLNIIVWICQYLGWNPIFLCNDYIKLGSEINGGLMGNVPRLAALLCLTASFQSLWILCMSIIICLITKQTAIFPIVAIMLFMRYKNEKIRTGIIVSFIAVICLFYEKIICSIITVRFDIWKRVLMSFFTQPIAGYGIGVFPWRDISIDVDRSIFSSLLQFIVGLGILAVVWLGCVLKKIKNGFNLSRENQALVALLILSVVEYPFEIERLWFYCIAIIGFWIIHNTKEAASCL